MKKLPSGSYFLFSDVQNSSVTQCGLAGELLLVVVHGCM